MGKNLSRWSGKSACDGWHEGAGFQGLVGGSCDRHSGRGGPCRRADRSFRRWGVGRVSREDRARRGEPVVRRHHEPCSTPEVPCADRPAAGLRCQERSHRQPGACRAARRVGRQTGSSPLSGSVRSGHRRGRSGRSSAPAAFPVTRSGWRTAWRGWCWSESRRSGWRPRSRRRGGRPDWVPPTPGPSPQRGRGGSCGPRGCYPSKFTVSMIFSAAARALAMSARGVVSGVNSPQLCTRAERSTPGLTGYS